MTNEEYTLKHRELEINIELLETRHNELITNTTLIVDRMCIQNRLAKLYDELRELQEEYEALPFE